MFEGRRLLGAVEGGILDKVGAVWQQRPSAVYCTKVVGEWEGGKGRETTKVALEPQKRYA
jgi:hypothetical protein